MIFNTRYFLKDLTPEGGEVKQDTLKREHMDFLK